VAGVIYSSYTVNRIPAVATIMQGYCPRYEAVNIDDVGMAVQFTPLSETGRSDELTE
jgi:hypothetical protein